MFLFLVYFEFTYRGYFLFFILGLFLGGTFDSVLCMSFYLA